LAPIIRSHRERLEACISGSPLDRPPVALWRHFPVDDQSPQTLTAATLNFQRAYDFDLVKVTPSSSYCIRDWGVGDTWNGAVEGTRDYVKRVIHRPEDWEKIPTLDPHSGTLGAQLESLEMIVQELGTETPVIQTIFNPLSQAKNLVSPEELIVHVRRYPEALHYGLKRITESTQCFVDAVSKTGVAGIFFAVQHAQYGLFSEAEYEEFGREYDLQILNLVKESWLNMLHLHGKEVMFDLLMDYPVQVINWHDRETSPTLAEAQTQYPGVVCGGLRRWDTMVLSTPEQVDVEAQDAIRQTNGKHFILGTGCVLPTIAPYGNILAARRSVENVN
jgi:uroporphyrinogen decarboxylase